MVNSCVAAYCSSSSNDTVTLFCFPKDQSQRNKWTKQVQRTRVFWKGPTKCSMLCSTHFTEDCFEPSSAIASTFGINIRRRLKPGAIPKIFKRPADDRCQSTSELDLPGTSAEKKSGGAYEKRERSRIVSEILAAAEREEKKEDAEQETTRDISVQFTVPRRDVKIQACPLAKSKATQVRPSVRDAGVQCDLLQTPGTSRLQKAARGVVSRGRPRGKAKGSHGKASRRGRPRCTGDLRQLVAVYKHAPQLEVTEDSVAVLADIESMAVQSLCAQYSINSSQS